MQLLLHIYCVTEGRITSILRGNCSFFYRPSPHQILQYHKQPRNQKIGTQVKKLMVAAVCTVQADWSNRAAVCRQSLGSAL